MRGSSHSTNPFWKVGQNATTVTTTTTSSVIQDCFGLDWVRGAGARAAGNIEPIILASRPEAKKGASAAA